MKSSEKLEEAYDLWASKLSRTEKRSAVERLASLGFSGYHIHKIVDLSVTAINRIINPENRIGGARWTFDKLEPKTLDAMCMLASAYEQSGHVSGPLARLIVEAGTGVQALGYYTGIPTEELREAIVS